MNDVVENFFLSVAGAGNEHTFFLSLTSFFIVASIFLFLVEPITD